MSQIASRQLRLFAYAIGFFLNIHLAFPSYFNPIFVSRFVAQNLLGLVFGLASFLALIAVLYLPRLIKTYGNVRTAKRLAGVGIIIGLGLVLFGNGWWAIFLFIVYYLIGTVLKVNIDVFLESASRDDTTGGIRGVFMTLVNLAWLLSPFLAGQLVNRGHFDYIYLLSAAMLLPILFLPDGKLAGEELADVSIRRAAAKLLSAQRGTWLNLRRIMLIDLLLNFFYGIMVVYMALYLSNRFNFSAADIGIIFTIMLIPFVVVDYPLGWLADRWGEKEILMLGLIVTALATVAIPFVGVASVAVWAIVLFMTRVGASITEIMKETYLFKCVDSTDLATISLSRATLPLGYMLGPIFGACFLSLGGSLGILFAVLGVIMFLGLFPVTPLRDTN